MKYHWKLGPVQYYNEIPFEIKTSPILQWNTIWN